MATDDTAHPQVRVFRLRNRLREKVNGLAARGRGSIPDELLQIAGSELARIVASYPDHLATMIATLARAVAAAQAVSPASRAGHFAEMNGIAYELEGQGTTFGYPLISEFGGALHEFTLPDARRTDAHLEIIKANIDALHALAKARIEGDGGAVGRALQAEFRRLVAKRLKQIAADETAGPGGAPTGGRHA